MSVAAMNWALRQRLTSPLQQILLYVIADSADPEGCTRFCDPAYMEEHARLTRSTLFRTLGDLEILGLLERKKFYSERGDVRYEMTLNFEALVDIPIRRRKKVEDTSDSGENSDEAQDDGAESHHEIVVETDHSPTGAKTKSQSDDYHKGPSLPKEDSHPYPSPRGSHSKMELEAEGKRDLLWQRFKQGYPSIAAMDQHEARDALDSLSFDDAEWAVSVLPALKEELRKAHDRPPKNAHIWLRKAMFRNFPKATLDAPPPEGVWIADGSDEDRALRFVRILARAPNPFVLTRDGTRGYLNRTEVGLDLLAMLAFESEIPLRWPRAAKGSPEYAAWQQRFMAWIATPLPLEPGTETIQVPCQWPPSKEGTIYRNDEDIPRAS